jgi:hypothetical protein
MPEYSRFFRCETALSTALVLATLVSMKPVLGTRSVSACLPTFRDARRCQLPDSGYFAGLVLHSEPIPVEKLANQTIASNAKKKLTGNRSEFKSNLPLLCRIRSYTFGVQNWTIRLYPDCNRNTSTP